MGACPAGSMGACPAHTRYLLSCIDVPGLTNPIGSVERARLVRSSAADIIGEWWELQNFKSKMPEKVKLNMPEKVNMILNVLESAGYEAYVVGGCIRDNLMGKDPGDWDIATSARPRQTKACFPQLKTADVGIGHGTVGLIVEGEIFEVTTFRSDGRYSDLRHPDKVTFSDTIEEDLARRDFTMNAMAYGEKRGLIDIFGGRRDIENRVIRIVGRPEDRFAEDALRIFRALRFAAETGFDIESSTESSIYDLYGTLNLLPMERLNAEFTGIILGDFGEETVNRYKMIFEEVFGIRLPSKIRFSYLPKDKALRLASLLPKNDDTIASASPDDFKRLKFDNKTVREVRDIRNASRDFDASENAVHTNKLFLKKNLRQYGESAVRKALILNEEPQDELDEIIERGECYSLKQLAVTGRDIGDMIFKEDSDGTTRLQKARPPSDPLIGKLLERLLDAVIAEKIRNERKELLDYAQTELSKLRKSK